MFEIDKVRFGAFVAQLRREKGLTQKELAEKLFVSDKAVSKWERGLSIPDVAILIPLAQLLGISVTELLECRRLPQDAPMDSAQTEELVKKVIGMSEEESRKYRPDRVRRGVQLLLCAVTGCLELWLLTCLGYSVEELSVNLFTMMGLMAGFGLYFCVFAREKLPKYYDDNRISSFSDGFLRMNLPGVYFNNRNWPYIVRAAQLWAMIGLVAAPVVFYIMNTLFPGVWDVAGIGFVLLFTLGGLFGPMVWAAKKYEFGLEGTRTDAKSRRDWRWIGTVAVVALILVLTLRPGYPSSGSGVKVMYSEGSTRSSWSASYAYYDGYRQRTVNADGDTAVMEVSVVTSGGTFGMVVTDETGDVLFSQENIETSTFSVDLPGKARVKIIVEEHKGSFSMSW